ncbi:EnvZ/OmpR regulon moderator MzrA [Citrobacter sp. RHB25-C09]|uniref:EnvZ/OmpR regulon moderator MzrA n=1 Tax=Citrobacter sp. RHB25-C09 TaxID=2742624 RepID=UPI0015EE3D1D|nr:EnvZ/OmpR regulon moderator MzrA [Citrobacter sp. RHB25-C09]QMI03848.1 EnvZ/OmpR regulon moderator MzrA [Citrobacter sp. RHB25-C09]
MLKPRVTIKQLAWSTAFLILMGTLLLVWSAIRQQESTLSIRAVHQGTSMPDGFSIWHHLDANGIQFKSITPQKDTLLITFDSSAQSAAAKVVLDKSLPQGYIIAQLDDDNQAVQWLSRLRDTPHRLG